MEFERPLVELENKLEELRRLDVAGSPDLLAEIERVAAEVAELHETLYESLGPWEKVQVSRHPDRPKTDDYLCELFEDVFELRGDRAFADDPAVLTALARLGDRRVVVIGHRKGRGTKENVHRRFGSPNPEGFRKAARAMRLAERFGLPVVTLVDTPGAYPGLEAEERGQAWAIAANLEVLSGLRVPVIVVGIGEGGSGGALAMGFGDRLIMLENAYYSVISPEACASILHKDAARASEVAGCLSLTADELVELGIADEILPEPVGGAHAEPEGVIRSVGEAIDRALGELGDTDPHDLVERRYQRLRSIGVWDEPPGTGAATDAGGEHS